MKSDTFGDRSPWFLLIQFSQNPLHSGQAQPSILAPRMSPQLPTHRLQGTWSPNPSCRGRDVGTGGRRSPSSVCPDRVGSGTSTFGTSMVRPVSTSAFQLQVRFGVRVVTDAPPRGDSLPQPPRDAHNFLAPTLAASRLPPSIHPVLLRSCSRDLSSPSRPNFSLRLASCTKRPFLSFT